MGGFLWIIASYSEVPIIKSSTLYCRKLGGAHFRLCGIYRTSPWFHTENNALLHVAPHYASPVSILAVQVIVMCIWVLKDAKAGKGH